MKETFDKSWLKKKPVAHRGLHHNPEIPENSLLSFQKAIDANYPIEFDLQVTRDGKLIVFHDDDLKRVCGDERQVGEVDFSELIEKKLFDGNEKIPSFKKALEFIAGRVPLLIEVKNRNYNGELESLVLEELKNYKGEFALQSFNPFTVHHFKKKCPQVPRGIISGTGKDFGLSAWKVFVLRNLLLLPYVKPHFINYEAEGLSLPSISLIRKFTRIPIISWTIDSEKKLKMIRGQCDNIIFESFEAGALWPSN